MRERINRLAKGIIEDELPVVVCEPCNIDLPVAADEAVRFEVAVSSENGVHLKGIAYSDNIRVRIVDSIFGGVKTKIILEINSKNLKSDDSIDGSVSLITNAGEYEIPYHFYIRNTNTVRVLDSLETVDDFLVIAKEDINTALAIFMYKDFYKAGFMKDLRLQKIYEALNNGGEFRSNLESFLVSTGKKEPVTFMLETDRLSFATVEEKKECSVKLLKEGWGLLDIDVSTNAPFITLGTAKIENEDFTDDEYNFTFDIEPEYLEDRKNIANIRFRSGLREERLEIVINKDIEKEYRREARNYQKKQWILYMKLRVEYELSSERLDRNEILLKMLEVLDKLLINTDREELVKLLKAELLLQLEDKASAKSVINSISDRVKDRKQELRDEYLMLEYLDTYIYPDSEKIKGLNKLIKDLYRRDRSVIEFMLILSIDDNIKTNPSEKQRFLKQVFENGDCSKFLMMEYARLLSKNPKLLLEMGTFEVLALNFGIRNNLISLSLSERIMEVVRDTRRINGAILNILLSIYNAIPGNELLADICEILIKGNVRKNYINKWYKRCIEKGLEVDNVYEYFVYSLPERYDEAMPESLLRYFERINSLEEDFKLRIYENVVEFYPQNSEVYRAYIKRINIFTVDNAMRLKMDEHLINIYSRILRMDMVDERLAKIIPFLMNSYRIWVGEEDADSIVVVYPELKGEKRYKLAGGKAFVALYSENAIILPEDSLGNRFYSKELDIGKIFNMPQLIERAYEIDETHDMYRLERLGKMLNTDIISQKDMELIEGSIDEIDIDRRFKNRIFSKVIEYFWSCSQEDDSAVNFEFLSKMGEMTLDADDVFMYCDTLINIGNITEALGIIKAFGIEQIATKNLLKLVTKAIEDDSISQNKILSAMAFLLYKKNEYNDMTLEFLAKVYNGRTDDMYECLKLCIEKNVETYDLEERVLSQMLFTNQTDRIDEVFAVYADRKKVSDTIVRAYFTVKSDAFFMKGEAAKDNVFEYLEDGLSDLEDAAEAPIIYILALSKYYSAKESLGFKQLKLCEELVRVLSEQGLIFEYFKILDKFVDIDKDIMESTFVEYRAEGDEVVLESRLLPFEEEFEEESFPNVYKNIFVKYKKIFSDEIWDYRILGRGGEKVLAEDCVQFLPENDKNDSRFLLINSLEASNEEIKDKMTDYIYKDELVKNLFTLM